MTSRSLYPVVGAPHGSARASRRRTVALTCCATPVPGICWRSGLSLKEIGDHLGHRRPDSTRIYAKVDLQGLREVAAFDLGGLV